MNDNGGDFDAIQLADQVEITEAFPHRLLNSRDDAERSEIGRLVWIGEVAGDAQLERTLSICRGISLAKSGSRQPFSKSLDLRTRLTAGEFGVKLAPVLARQSRRIDQHQPRRRNEMRVSPLLD